MPVIAMTQEIGTRGSDVAQGVAQALGIGLVSHDLADRLADRMHVKKSLVQRLREGKASLFERLSTSSSEVSAHTAEEVLRLAQEGDVLIRGWGSTMVLHPVAHVPCIRVCAPLPARIRTLLERLDTDDEDMVRDQIARSDAAHAAAMHARFHVTWGDGLLYDLTLNTDRLSVETCVEQIVALVRRPEFAETRESHAHLADLALAARVRTALLDDPRTADAHITMNGEGDRVRLRGIVPDQDVLDACVEVASEVQGVAEVLNELKTMRRR
jgi:osmotically-inducible protein OsmY